jgi:hypothetical protein
MPTMQVDLPDEVAEVMKDKGLLNSDGITELLREALRAQALDCITEFVNENERRGIVPFSEAEIEAEIQAVRKERQA